MSNEEKAVFSATATVGAIPVAGTAVETSTKTARLYYLDWVKVGCIALLIPYHAALIFASYLPYHIKTQETSVVFTVFNLIVLFWYVAVLMLIAGYGARLALRRRTIGQFVMERVKRLLLPLVFGILVIVPPQIYMERLYKGEISYGYLEFYSHLFTQGVYPTGNLSWHHLWYIAYLFVISLVLLPLCLRVKKWSSAPGSSKLMDLLCTKYGNLLLVVPFLILEYTLRVYFPYSYPDFIHDGLNFLLICIFYMYGFVMAGNERLFNAFLNTRGISAIVAVFSICLYFSLVLTGVYNPNSQAVGVVRLMQAWRGLVMWSCTAAIIGYAAKFLNRNSPVLQYAAKAFLPVYIVHQTILFIFAYYVLPLKMGLFGRFALLSVLTFVFSLLVYEFVIRRFKAIRLFFGI